MGAGHGVALEWRTVARLRPVLAVVVGFGFGAVPFSNLMARGRAGVDLRSVGNGTVSGASPVGGGGQRATVVAGLFELAKGAAGPLLAGRSHPVAAALAGGAAVAGHNWSPFLGGAGGRGISPAMGSLLVTAPVGSAVLMGGLIGGRLAGETALGSLLADLALVPAAARAHGRQGLLAGLTVVVPMVAKRLSGNAPVADGDPLTYVNRLLFDRDSRGEPRADAGGGKLSVGIVTDSACSLPAQLAQDSGVTVVPMWVAIGGPSTATGPQHGGGTRSDGGGSEHVVPCPGGTGPSR